MKNIRLAVLGLGVMGSHHARQVLSGAVPRLELTAVVDSDPSRLAGFPGIAGFGSLAELIAARCVDALLIATPHFDHTPAGTLALESGLHVLVEKPISVHKADAVKLLAAHTGAGQVFAAMFNQRTHPGYRRLRELIRGGDVGPVRRIQWTITDWFRTDAYYASGSWRATWAGEGGGVLLNQSPHQLDLFCWIFGMPARVRAFCHFGKYHDIEVEDEVIAYMEFPNGATAVFITSTGEAPGTNRLEIAAEMGRIVLEGDVLRFSRNSEPMSQFARRSPQAFAKPDVSEEIVPVPAGAGGQHTEILSNFADAITDGAPLIAPAAEGIQSVELANAMLLSTWTGETVQLPIDGAVYQDWLQRKIDGSRARLTKVRA